MSQNTDSALNASGRFGRRAYLAWNMLLSFGLMIVAVIIMAIFPIQFFSPDGSLSTTFALSMLIIYGIALYFVVIFTIRRLHDRGHSGWLTLLILVPLVNVFFMLYLLFFPGQGKLNDYGSPRPTRAWETVLAAIYVLFIVLGIVAAIAIPSYQNALLPSAPSSLQAP